LPRGNAKTTIREEKASRGWKTESWTDPRHVPGNSMKEEKVGERLKIPTWDGSGPLGEKDEKGEEK